jgi:hypothetical protein
MARSLETKYLIIAVAVSAVLALLLGGFAYYEHRVNTTDTNQLTYATVEKSLEADLEQRASSLSKITSSSLAPALAAGNTVAIAAIAEKLLDERDIARVAVLDAHDRVVFSGANSVDQPDAGGPFFLQTTVRSNLGQWNSPKVGTLQISMSRAQMAPSISPASWPRPSPRWSRAPIRSARGITPGHWQWCAGTKSAICNLRSSACART